MLRAWRRLLSNRRWQRPSVLTGPSDKPPEVTLNVTLRSFTWRQLGIRLPSNAQEWKQKVVLGNWNDVLKVGFPDFGLDPAVQLAVNISGGSDQAQVMAKVFPGANLMNSAQIERIFRDLQYAFNALRLGSADNTIFLDSQGTLQYYYALYKYPVTSLDFAIQYLWEYSIIFIGVVNGWGMDTVMRIKTSCLMC